MPKPDDIPFADIPLADIPLATHADHPVFIACFRGLSLYLLIDHEDRSQLSFGPTHMRGERAERQRFGVCGVIEQGVLTCNFH